MRRDGDQSLTEETMASIRVGGELEMLDLKVTPKIFAASSLLKVKMLKSEPRALVTELSIHVGISKPACRGSGPHRGREVVTFTAPESAEHARGLVL